MFVLLLCALHTPSKVMYTWFMYNNIICNISIYTGVWLRQWLKCSLVEHHIREKMSVHHDQILLQVGDGSMNPMQTAIMKESLDNGRVPTDLDEFLNACFKL